MSTVNGIGMLRGVRSARTDSRGRAEGRCGRDEPDGPRAAIRRRGAREQAHGDAGDQ